MSRRALTAVPTRTLAGALLVGALLVGCSSSGPEPSPAPTGPAVLLDGDELGVTKVGADQSVAVQAVTAALGAPTAQPAEDVACVASEEEVAFGDLRLAFSGGRLAGWMNRRPDLRSSEGIAVGSTVADVLEVYGDTVALQGGTTDAGETFAADGGLSGGLTSEAPDGTVTYLYNGVCSPP